MPFTFTFYRVTYSVNGGNSGGYSWHTSRRAALAAAKKEDPAEYDNHFAGLRRIDVIRIVPTKAGVLAALSQYASYPDNG